MAVLLWLAELRAAAAGVALGYLAWLGLRLHDRLWRLPRTLARIAVGLSGDEHPRPEWLVESDLAMLAQGRARACRLAAWHVPRLADDPLVCSLALTRLEAAGEQPGRGAVPGLRWDWSPVLAAGAAAATTVVLLGDRTPGPVLEPVARWAWGVVVAVLAAAVGWVRVRGR